MKYAAMCSTKYAGICTNKQITNIQYMCIINMLKYAKTNIANICKYTICINMHRVCTNMQICIFKIFINLYASICITCSNMHKDKYAIICKFKYA